MKLFDIPVVLFMFKRTDTLLRIVQRIKEVRPQKLYLIGDAGRNDQEKELVQKCRSEVENAITWPCEVIKNYATENRGVHEQIGMGALWIFQNEEKAIFLEDDNLPEVSFFQYCKECLEKYEQDENIFWICGTNYLQKCSPKNNTDVFKSQHLMPCGWASWRGKFIKYYDCALKLTENKNWKNSLKKKYSNRSLYHQQLRSIEAEVDRKTNEARYRSWDFHTVLSIRMNDLWGIVPKYNQIENIGVDEFSTHGGNNLELEMTKRFCDIKTYKLEEPLNLPDSNELDDSFENAIGKIILYPFKARMIMFWREKLVLPEGVRLRHAFRYLLTRKQ